MAFHSFLSSQRLHWGAQRAWSDPLPIQLNRILHEFTAQMQGPAGLIEATPGEPATRTDASRLTHIGFVDEPGP